MKKTLIVTITIALLTTMLLTAAGSMEYQDMEGSSISTQEAEGLQLMREEEKLARDVYLAIAEMYSIRSFSNIAESEQTHMEAVGRLLEQYGIEDPIEQDVQGVFQSAELQSLYDELIDRAEQSAGEAVLIGMMIEDLDIADLSRLIGETEEQDIIFTYEQLLKGSLNHYQAFSRQLSKYGLSYQPVYSSEEMLRF